MKRFITILLLLVSFLIYSQSKPSYLIDVHRNENSIGLIKVELFPDFAPNHVLYWDSLVNIDFFDSLAFHRVIEGFVIQGGDPNTLNLPDSTWGVGQPNQQTVDAEFNPVSYIRGVLGAARDEDPNSANSQFFICHDNATFLTGNYTAYGRVIEGINIVDSVAIFPTDTEDRPLIKTIMFIDRSEDIPSEIQPTLLITEDSIDNVNYFKSLEWETNTEAIYYEIELSRDSDFSLIEQSKTDNDNSVVFTNLETGGIRYFWRVTAYDGASSSVSETRTFLTKFLASQESIQQENDFYFNQDNKTLILTDASEYRNIIIYDIHGSIVYNQSLSNNVSLNKLSKGLYVISLLGKNKKYSFKIIID